MELVNLGQNNTKETMNNATNNAILSQTDDKIAIYKDLLAKVIPFTKSANILEKRAAYDLNILLKCGINKTNNTVLMYLSDALDHLIKHFMPDLNTLINNQIVLDDITVSRSHALITKDEGYRLKDLGSLNGSYINAVAVKESAIKAGDEVQIGKYHLTLFIGDK